LFATWIGKLLRCCCIILHIQQSHTLYFLLQVYVRAKKNNKKGSKKVASFPSASIQAAKHLKKIKQYKYKIQDRQIFKSRGIKSPIKCLRMMKLGIIQINSSFYKRLLNIYFKTSAKKTPDSCLIELQVFEPTQPLIWRRPNFSF